MSASSDSSTVIVTGVPPLPKSNSELHSVKNSILLEKISEIDESESRALSGYLSRPATNRVPTQRSQATFRSSVLKGDGDSEDDSQSDDENDKPKEGVLMTELAPEMYDDESDVGSLPDDDEISQYDKIKDVNKEADITNDNDYDTDLDDDNKEDDDEDDLNEVSVSKKEYRKMCKLLNIVPCSYFMAHIEDQTLVLKYHQFSNDEIRALTKPLWNNIHCEKLLLDGNWIEAQGAKYISRMIRQNDFITELSLNDNRVGDSIEGTKEICRMMSENCVLKKLNLSGNNFSDKNVQLLVEALEKNRLLNELDLSHNNFSEEAGKLIGAFISSNDTLEILDLSWNNFRNKGAKELAIGIRENVRLKKCNLSFNGFDAEGGKILAEVIKMNSSLQELNISNTRLTAENAAAIANALQVNDSLKVLNVSNNPISTSGALAIIYAIKLNKSSALEMLDLSEIPVIKEFLNVLKDVQEMKPNFVCRHGLVISTANTTSIFYEGNKDQKVDFEKIIASLKNKS